eukprot:1143711-Pelagomonas_calceolata.AAC.1
MSKVETLPMPTLGGQQQQPVSPLNGQTPAQSGLALAFGRFREYAASMFKQDMFAQQKPWSELADRTALSKPPNMAEVRFPLKRVPSGKASGKASLNAALAPTLHCVCLNTFTLGPLPTPHSHHHAGHQPHQEECGLFPGQLLHSSSSNLRSIFCVTPLLPSCAGRAPSGVGLPTVCEAEPAGHLRQADKVRHSPACYPCEREKMLGMTLISFITVFFLTK